MMNIIRIRKNVSMHWNEHKKLDFFGFLLYVVGTIINNLIFYTNEKKNF